MAKQPEAEEPILINGSYSIISTANNSNGNCHDAPNNATDLCGGSNTMQIENIHEMTSSKRQRQQNMKGKASIILSEKTLLKRIFE